MEALGIMGFIFSLVLLNQVAQLNKRVKELERKLDSQ